MIDPSIFINHDGIYTPSEIIIKRVINTAIFMLPGVLYGGISSSDFWLNVLIRNKANPVATSRMHSNKITKAGTEVETRTLRTFHLAKNTGNSGMPIMAALPSISPQLARGCNWNGFLTIKYLLL